MSVGGNKCALRAMLAGEKDFHEKKEIGSKFKFGEIVGTNYFGNQEGFCGG